jgi:hypothetical protein
MDRNPSLPSLGRFATLTFAVALPPGVMLAVVLGGVTFLVRSAGASLLPMGTVYIANSLCNTVTPITAATNTPDTPVGAGDNPFESV